MIIFYPRDIGMWRKEFDFSQDITLTPKAKTDCKGFHNQQEFFDFLKVNGVKFNDPRCPLEILDDIQPYHKGNKIVKQAILIGWLEDRCLPRT